MSFWTAMVAITAIVAMTILRLKRPHGRLDRNRLTDTRDSELEAEIAKLRQRIAVLERIATEDRKSRNIAEEIEALRE